ncbi:MAG: 4Fe-4S binding protein [Eubacteriaceae bacterium]|nr:4Fe-4S binding protein [Eubacteriaceae bacterium]
MNRNRRTAVQAFFTILQNANLRGFFTGKIYRGALKSVCVPGLNCYSCPGALGACPLGSLQNSLTSGAFRFPYYVLGLMVFFATLLGRGVCAFLCPMGLLQDLLDRVPLKKVKTFRGDRPLRYLKYVILAVFVIAIPLAVKLTPAFCKYVCPSGTLSGIMLAMADHRLFDLMGSRFILKAAILLLIIIASVKICRPFCRYICPLGAFYSLFNRVSLLRLELDRESCVHCGACSDACGMGADPAQDPDSPECIRCGACIHACPRGALLYGTGGFGASLKAENKK